MPQLTRSIRGKEDNKAVEPPTEVPPGDSQPEGDSPPSVKRPPTQESFIPLTLKVPG